MASGTERRAVATDSLKGAAQVSTAPVPKPQLPQVNAKAEDVVNTPAAKVARSINSFAGKKFQEAANVHNEKNFLDGQIAAAQGQAFEDAEFKGNKWKLAGYRATEAETITATLFASQREMLRQVDYQDDPDAYRAKLVSRLEQQIDGLDPFTAQIVRKQFAAQSSTLVAEHTSANLQYQEQQAFDATVDSIDIMSKDDTQLGNLLSNASGTGGTAGLSIDRRETAVTQGVINAYDNMNPLAYQRLKNAGIIDQLPHAHQQKIKQAEENYQSRLREQYSAEFEADMTALEQKVATGKYNPVEITNMLADVYADNGMKVRGTEQKAAHAAAQGAAELYEQGNHVIYNQAVQAGDFEAIAALADEAMIFHESGGDPYAVGPVITAGANKGDQAQGIRQVMPNTGDDPGFGIVPSNGTMEDTARVGKQLFREMLKGSGGNYGLPWPMGDIEAAAVAYNAGHVNAKKWFAAGRDYSVLPKRKETEPYAKGILARATGVTHTQTAEYRLETAQQMAKAAQKQIDMTSYENFAIERAELDSLYSQPGSTMTSEQYMEANRALNAKHDVERSQAMSSHMLGVVDDVAKAAQKTLEEAEEAAEAEMMEGLDTQRIILTDQYERQMANPDIPLDEKQKLGEEYLNQVTQMYNEAGVPSATWEPSQTISAIVSGFNKANDVARKRHEEDQLIAIAERDGTISSLPKSLRERYWQEKREATARATSEQAASMGLPTDEQQVMVEQSAIASWVQAGEVDPSVGSANAATMMGNLVADDKRPSPRVVSMIERYRDLKSSNPYIAESFFGKNDDARARAEAVLAAGSGDPVEGIANIEYEKTSFAHLPKTDMSAEEIKAASINAAMAEAKRQDIRWIQDMFEAGDGQRHETTFRERAAREAEAEAVYGPAVEAEIDFLSTRSGMSAKNVMSLANANVQKRSAFVGESVLLYPRDQSFLGNALGQKEAEKFIGKAGIEDEIIAQYLRDNPDNIPVFEGATDFAGGTESNVLLASTLAQVTQQVGDVLVDGTAGLFGLDLDLIGDTPLSPIEARGAQNKGVRPYRVATDMAGNTYLSYLKTDGDWTDPMAINLQSAGKNWQQNGKSAKTWENTQKKRAVINRPSTPSLFKGGPFAGQ